MITLEKSISYSFKNTDLLTQSITHKSFHNENITSSPGHNERLEYLGDAVLDLALSDLLFRLRPEMTEGELSKVRASLVNEQVLSEIALEYQLQDYMKLGRGETQTGGALKPRLLASSFEALIGAIYLDGGFEVSFGFIQRAFDKRLMSIDTENHFSTDYKTRLQEKVQERFKKIPVYKLTKEEGPDHSKVFFIELYIDDNLVSKGQGRSKKQAEQEAAKIALEEL